MRERLSLDSAIERPSHPRRGLLRCRQRFHLLGHRWWARPCCRRRCGSPAWGIDLKCGIELSVDSALFTKIATTEPDAVEPLPRCRS